MDRARIQDRIHKELAMERAKSLIAMIVQRREYVKSLKKAKYNERMSPGQRRQAKVSPPLPIDKPHDSNPVIQLRRTEDIPPTRIDGDAVIGSANDCRERGKSFAEGYCVTVKTEYSILNANSTYYSY